jgi:hypothetical protein
MIPLTFPDAQLVVADHLRPLLGPVPIGVQVPNPRPAVFVTVRRAGGVRDRVTDRPRIDVLAWADTDTAAHDLVGVCRRHLAALPGVRGGVRVTAVAEFAGPVPAPDPSGQPRWLVTYEITLRGTP